MKLFKFSVLLIGCLLYSGLVNAQIRWQNSYDLAKILAKEQNKLIVVDCWANWCGPCLAMDDEVWSNEKIQSYSDSFIFVKIDLSSGFSNRYFSVKSIPAIFICDAWNTQMKNYTGYRNYSEMGKILKSYSFDVSAIYRDKQKFAEKSAKMHLKLAMTYCESKINLEIDPYVSLKHLSKMHFKNAKKIFKKAGDRVGLNRSLILETLNLKAKKRLKIVSSLDLHDRENVMLKNAIKAKSYFELENKEKAYEYFKKVKTIRLPYYDFLKNERKLFNKKT